MDVGTVYPNAAQSMRAIHGIGTSIGLWAHRRRLFKRLRQNMDSDHNGLGFSVAPVPEPTTWTTFAGFCLLVSAIARRRRLRQAP